MNTNVNYTNLKYWKCQFGLSLSQTLFIYAETYIDVAKKEKDYLKWTHISEASTRMNICIYICHKKIGIQNNPGTSINFVNLFGQQIWVEESRGFTCKIFLALKKNFENIWHKVGTHTSEFVSKLYQPHLLTFVR